MSGDPRARAGRARRPRAGAAGAARVGRRPGRRARSPRSSSSAVVQMYGAGPASRSSRSLAEARRAPALAATLADDPLVATLLMIHDLHPVPLEARVAEALERVRPYMESHGGDVELLELRGRRRPDPPAGQLLQLLGIVGHARAGDQAGARGGRARPGRAGGRGHRAGAEPPRRPRPLRGSTACRSRAAPTPAWFEVDRLAALPAGELAHGRDRRRARSWSPTSTARCSPIRDACAGCGGPLHDGELEAGALALPGLRAQLLPAPRRAVDGRRPAAARARCRCCATRAGEGGAGDVTATATAIRRWPARRTARHRRGGREPPPRAGGQRPARPAAAGAAAPLRPRTGERCDICGTTVPRRPPPPAAAGRAADRVRLRELLGASLGRRRVPADRQPDRRGCRTSSSRTTCGRPSRSRSGSRSSWTRPRPAASSRSIRARAARPRASCTSRRGAGWSS